ncbi:MAG: hypothetical protein COW84_06955, partial [Gammaproteobacteria bacterium CG22_combo_CG10-13_8_21_14_all_40_8]
MRSTFRVLGVINLSFLLMTASWADDDTQFQQLMNLNFEQLMQVKVSTVSNRPESLADAPATVIVLTQDDFQKRGYQDLSQIFDDLPGMEMIRPYGDSYYVNYMRGYRYTIGSPYLVMIDGVIMNTMYFSITTPLAAFPMSHVERVEVVYGPVSSVYGANASMGVVNIITRKQCQKNNSLDGHVGYGTDDSFISDLSYCHQSGDYGFRFTTRWEDANLNKRIDNEQNYWLQDSRYNDRQQWGDFLDEAPLVADHFSSYLGHRSFDARLFSGHGELAAQYLMLDSGYGTIYPGDRIPANSTWPRIQYNIYSKYHIELNDQLTSKTLLRYRFDGITNDSHDLEAWNETNQTNETINIGGIDLEPGQSARMLHFSYWQTQNRGWSLFQDFEYNPQKAWSLVAGFKYEYKDLQKAYDLPNSGPIAVSLADPTNSSLFPEPPSTAFDYSNRNRIIWRDKGVYLQGKYQLPDDSVVNAGVRVDNNSSYGTATTLRLGYVKPMGQYIVKLLYGEAFQEPVPRSLYGAWTGSGSDPTLDPEQSKTMEMHVSRTTSQTSQWLSLYGVESSNTVINFTGGARNAGVRDVIGLDYYFSIKKSVPWLNEVNFWSYASFYLKEKEDIFDLASGDKIGRGRIGDLAHQKYYLGMTSSLSNDSSLTLIGRYVSKRNTVATNPLGEIPSYFVMDANYVLNNVANAGLTLSLKVENLFNKDYFNPGVRDANAGEPLVDTSLINDIGFSGDN